MIPTTTYLIGFLVYLGFCVLTIKYTSKINKEYLLIKIIFVYIYYSIIIGYWLSIVDVTGTQFELIVQTIIYLLTSSLFLFFYYKNTIQQGFTDYFKE